MIQKRVEYSTPRSTETYALIGYHKVTLNDWLELLPKAFWTCSKVGIRV